MGTHHWAYSLGAAVVVMLSHLQLLLLLLLHLLVASLLSLLPHLSGHHHSLYSPSVVAHGSRSHWTAHCGGRVSVGYNTCVQCYFPGVTRLDWTYNVHARTHTHTHAHTHTHTHTLDGPGLAVPLAAALVLGMQQRPLPPSPVGGVDTAV